MLAFITEIIQVSLPLKKNTVSFGATALITETDLFIDTILLPNFYHEVFVNSGQHSIQGVLHFVILEPDKSFPLKDKNQNVSRLMSKLVLLSHLCVLD